MYKIYHDKIDYFIDISKTVVTNSIYFFSFIFIFIFTIIDEFSKNPTGEF